MNRYEITTCVNCKNSTDKNSENIKDGNLRCKVHKFIVCESSGNGCTEYKALIHHNKSK